MGPKGQKGDGGEPGPPGLPGASHVSVVSGRFGEQTILGDSLKGEKGEQGPAVRTTCIIFRKLLSFRVMKYFLGFIIQGPPGKRGLKGERGETAGFIIKNGQYTLVKV